MRAFAEYKIKTLGKWYPTALPTGVGLKNFRNISNYRQSYGEWAEPADVKTLEFKDFVNPNPEETTAYIVFMLEAMADIARILGKDDDRRLYEKECGEGEKGLQRARLHEKILARYRSPGEACAPAFYRSAERKAVGIREKAAHKSPRQLLVEARHGFLSTPLILSVLADIDIEYAYRLLENEQMPGWLFMPKTARTPSGSRGEGTAAQGGIALAQSLFQGRRVRVAVWHDVRNKCCRRKPIHYSPAPGRAFRSSPKRATTAIYGKISVRWDKTDGDTNIKYPSRRTAKRI